MTNGKPEPSIITITFGVGQTVELRYEGPVSSYMMLGAAGVLTAQANIGIATATRDAQKRAITPVQTIPTDLKR